MRIDRTMCLTAIGAIGAGLLVFPFLPGHWPNPLQEGVRLRAVDLLQLKMAAARVDLACRNGDVARFAEAVTDEHRGRLAQQLEVVERALDRAALRQLATDRDFSFAELLRRPVLASEVRGARAAVAVARPAGDGAQVLEFVWDGRRLRLDDSRQVAAVADRDGARAVVRDAVMK